MKIRSGFVSNSSNTSFYLKLESLEKAVKIIAEVAMMDYFKNDWVLKPGDLAIWFERLEKINSFFKKNPSYNDPVKLPYTWNNDTYIWDDGEGNGFLVDTCNNTSWYDYIEEFIYSGTSDELYFSGTSYFDLDEMELKTK